MSDKLVIGKVIFGGKHEPELHMPDIDCAYCNEKDKRIAELEEARDNACNDCDMWRSKCEELQNRIAELKNTIYDLQMADPQIIKEIIREVRMYQSMFSQHPSTAEEVIARSYNEKLVALADYIEALSVKIEEERLRFKAQAAAVRIYVESLDGSVGSPMWRIRTDILAALEQADE